MKFRNIKINNNESKWYLIIDNLGDLYTYLNHDIKQYDLVLKSMAKDDETGNIRLDHLFSHREVILSTMIKSKIFGAEKETNVYAHDILKEVSNNKIDVMTQHILNTGAMQINTETGGWCSVKAFDDIWKPEILEECEVDSVVAPNNEKPIECELLILENENKVNKLFLNELKSLGFKGYTRTIKLLKDKDQNWVMENIKLAINIAFETKALDKIQINNFMLFFSTIQTKNLYIKTDNKNAITDHDLFEINSQKHNIKFL